MDGCRLVNDYIKGITAYRIYFLHCAKPGKHASSSCIKFHTMQNTILTGLFISFVLLSCKVQHLPVNDLPKEPGSADVSLDSNKWYLVRIHQSTGTTEVTTRRAFIHFNKTKGSAGGNGSCNSFGSTMNLDGKKVSFTDIFSTKMYCDDVQSIENSFLGQLGKVTRYEVKGRSLLLFDKENVALEFERE